MLWLFVVEGFLGVDFGDFLVVIFGKEIGVQDED
jgi:hypothetical protein